MTWWNSRSLQTIFGNFSFIKISHRKIQNFLFAVSSVSFCAQHIKFYVIAYLRSLSKNCHAYFWNGRSYYWTTKKILYWYSKILKFNSISLESLFYIFYGWFEKMGKFVIKHCQIQIALHTSKCLTFCCTNLFRPSPVKRSLLSWLLQP